MSQSPFFDFFKRGEVARDVRLLAAQGAIAPRASEQLAILVLLLDDPDPEIRRVADGTLNRIPSAAISAFLGRSDVTFSLREFFADRGIFPAVTPDLAAFEPEEDAPLVDADGDEPAGEDDDRATVVQKLAKMTFTERLKAAMKGSREMRSILVRDSNKMIAAAVMSSPKLTEQEVDAIARMANVSEDVLRIIASRRAWLKRYSIVLGLAKNPKTPLAISLGFVSRLVDRDLQSLSVDRNVPEPLRIAARKRVVAGLNR
jgi:hypothetical protein